MKVMKDELLNWTLLQGSKLGYKDILSLDPLREQASLRSYFRALTNTGTKIVVSTKPDSEENKLFESHSNFLIKNGIAVPKVEASDHKKGLMILEDFGDKVLQLEIDPKNKEEFYKNAIKQIHKIQSCKPSPGLSRLTAEILSDQMKLSEEWFLSGLLNMKFSDYENQVLKNSWNIISTECSKQPYTLCHFDFEFRNLMLLSEGNIGILDFQDLCIAPYTIDLVSILKDLENPLTNKELIDYLQFYYEANQDSGEISKSSLEDLKKDVDFAGFQRQFRILGTLSRLHLRDQKSFRLFDLIQTLKFLFEDSINYPDLREMGELLKDKVEPKLIKTLESIK